jgi:hypothetical protein
MHEVKVELDYQNDTRWVTRNGRHYPMAFASMPSKIEAMTDEEFLATKMTWAPENETMYQEFKERELKLGKPVIEKKNASQSFADCVDEIDASSHGKLKSNLSMYLVVNIAMMVAYCTGRWISDGKNPERQNWSVDQWEQLDK